MPSPETDDFWLREGKGIAPKRKWTQATDGNLVAMSLARESGELFVADESGAITRIDRSGKILSMTRTRRPVQKMAWSDHGEWGIAVTSENVIRRLDRNLKQEWDVEVPDTCLAVAITPYGHHMAVGLADAGVLIYNERQRRLARFDSIRPLSFLQFSAAQPVLFGAADHGVLCCHNMAGAQLWQENLFSNVGSFAATGDGDLLYLASFGHGIQTYDGDGGSVGAYVLEGTINRVAATFEPQRLVAATIERYLYWLDSDGEMLWASGAPSDIHSLACDPLGEWVIVGFTNGQVIRLDWT
jgi:hypothetical protein